MSPAKAQEMQAVVKEFHYTVRLWFGEIPLNTNLHTALDVLHFALHLTNGQLNRTIDDKRPDRSLSCYRGDVDCDE
jgi:hypothetical protein